MRTVIYARKSTNTEDKQVHSLDDQLKSMRALARREGYLVVETFTEAKSAKEPGKRPEFERMVAMIERGEAEAILTWAPNRLSRNPVDGGRLAYLLQTRKLRLIRTNDRTYQPEDSGVLLAIENAVATDYIVKLTSDVSRGMREKAERGWHVSKAPLGYMNDAETRQIVPDPERFDVLRKGWDLLLSGNLSVSEIHRRLVADGLSVRVGRKGAQSPISQSKLYDVFHNRTYVGEVPFKGRYLPGKHLAMVSEEEFARAQSIMGCSGKGKLPEKRALAFGGLLRCAACGCAIVGEVRKKHYPRAQRVVTYTYYHCTGSKGCSKRAVREEVLIDEAERTVTRLRVTRPTAEWLADAVASCLEREAVGTAQDLAGLERRKTEDEARLLRLSKMRLDGEIGAAEHAALRAEIIERQCSVREAIHDRRDHTGKVLNLIAKKLDAAVAAGEIDNLNRDPRVLAKVLRLSGSCLLNLFPFDFRIDPILAKIAAFEPLGDDSEKPKRGDSVPLFSVWWTLAQDLLNLATEAVILLEERRAAQTYQDRRWDKDNCWDL